MQRLNNRTNGVRCGPRRVRRGRSSGQSIHQTQGGSLTRGQHWPTNSRKLFGRYLRLNSGEAVASVTSAVSDYNSVLAPEPITDTRTAPSSKTQSGRLPTEDSGDEIRSE